MFGDVVRDLMDPACGAGSGATAPAESSGDQHAVGLGIVDDTGGGEGPGPDRPQAVPAGPSRQGLSWC